MIDAVTILELLATRRNVLLAGPPGTGKSMLLSDVASRFECAQETSVPTYDPDADVPITSSPTGGLPGEIGAATNRKVFRSVLHQCCAAFELPPPQVPFVCTVEIARELWGIFPTRLPEVCRRLNIPLVHHDAQSDAVACGRIVLAAMADGWRPRSQVRSAMANDCDRGFV